jgi:hypothetical protein
MAGNRRAGKPFAILRILSALRFLTFQPTVNPALI